MKQWQKWGCAAAIVVAAVLTAVLLSRHHGAKQKDAVIVKSIAPAPILATQTANAAVQGPSKVAATPLIATPAAPAVAWQAPDDMTTFNLAWLVLENDTSASGFAFYSQLFKTAFQADGKVPVPEPAGPRQPGTIYVSQNLLGDLGMQLRADCKKAYNGMMMGGSPLSEADAEIIGNAAAEAYGFKKVPQTKP